MKLLDSSFLIDLLRDKDEAYKKLDDLKDEIALFTTSINIFEVTRGIYLMKNADKTKKLTELLKLFSSFEVLDLNIDSAIKAAEIDGTLRAQGKDINAADSLIIGIALTNKVDTIITKNRSHFERIDGLKVESYW